MKQQYRRGVKTGLLNFCFFICPFRLQTFEVTYMLDTTFKGHSASKAILWLRLHMTKDLYVTRIIIVKVLTIAFVDENMSKTHT